MLVWETILGVRLRLDIGWKNELVAECHVNWIDASPLPASETTTEWGAPLRQALLTYEYHPFCGWPALPLDWSQIAPDSFRMRVMRALHEVPFGELRTYGQLAAEAGSPRAARAVGGFMAQNPWGLVVPCHRIVGSTGFLTGFAGQEQALPLKAYLLRHEGHTISDRFKIIP